MSLQIRLTDFVTAVATDIKDIRTKVSGDSTGALTGLTTTAKTSLIAAINEVNGKAAPTPPAGTETTAGILQIATQPEVNAGLVDTDAVSPLKLQTRLAAYAQPLAAELTALAGQTSTAYGRGFLTLVNQAGLMGLMRATSETVTGVVRLATQTETNTGTDDTTSVSPLKFQTRLAAFAQPLNANLTTLAGVVSGAMGRTLLGAADATAAKTSLGLATVATSGSASDLTTGTLPTSALPALAINETFVVVSQAAMLALTAQRGDFAIRTDINRSFVLSTDSPGTLADWKQVTAGGDVVSVSGRTGTVVLSSADVGLGNVDNTSDANKPVSTAQATADNLRLLKTANLSDVATPATALANLGGIASSAIGNPETDLVAAYTTAKA